MPYNLPNGRASVQAIRHFPSSLPLLLSPRTPFPAQLNITHRSLRELRAWAAELVSDGVQILDCGNSVGARRGGTSVADEVFDGSSAWHHHERHEGLEGLADLEGGSRGAAMATAAGGRVPLLVVGTKQDIGKGVQRTGAEVASDLGAAHVTVVSRGVSCRIICACHILVQPLETGLGIVWRAFPLGHNRRGSYHAHTMIAP